MSKRLQVLLEEAELEEIRRLAETAGMTVAEWVCQALREARRGRSGSSAARKQQALERAVGHAFPTGEVDQVLQEIEAGYLERSEP